VAVVEQTGQPVLEGGMLERVERPLEFPGPFRDGLFQFLRCRRRAALASVNSRFFFCSSAPTARSRLPGGPRERRPSRCRAGRPVSRLGNEAVRTRQVHRVAQHLYLAGRRDQNARGPRLQLVRVFRSSMPVMPGII